MIMHLEFLKSHFLPLAFYLRSTRLYVIRRKPHKERGDILFPRLIRGMHEIGNADWWDARFTWLLTPLSH